MVLDQNASVARLRTIRLCIFDVDGVLTDGGMYYGESGDEFKRFSTRDGMGLELLRATGMRVALMTRESCQIVVRRGNKLSVDKMYIGIRDKHGHLVRVEEDFKVHAREILYMGDDVNDIGIMRAVGVSACPSDAIPEVLRLADIVAAVGGGHGAVREVCDRIVEARDHA